MTPHQHPLIDKALKTDKLYIAAGGSYHSYKFMPKWGKLMVQRMLGPDPDTLEERLLKRMGWERSEEQTSVHRSVIPKHHIASTMRMTK